MPARALTIWSLAFVCAACSSSKLDDPSAGPGNASAGASAAGAAAVSPQSESVQVFDAARITSEMSAPNFQAQMADIDFSAGPFQSVKLVADLGTTCFPFAGWKDDRPLTGQNWPADCDAFDRNFEISLDDPDPATADALPGMELVRAITPFGGPMHIERDLTAIANAQPGSHRLRAHINTYADAAGLVTGSAAGWNVSLRLELVRGPAAERPLAVVPLFYGDVTTSDPLSATFTIPEGTTHGYLEYRSTGHGQAPGTIFQCSGPAEEFCSREHTIQLDGATLKTFTPWRTCASACTLLTNDADAGFDYCAENPCGAIASVKASRANWCPGSETLPLVLDAPELATPGVHEVSWQVSQIAMGGSVRVSLTYFAFAG
jgi:hypothetical protein